MNELFSQIYGFGRAAWHRRKVALITAWCAALAIWMITMMLPDRYEASARVYVDVRSPLQPVLEGIAIETDYESQVSLVRTALLSRPQLEAVARKTNLDKDVTTPREMDALVTDLQGQISVVAAAAESGNPNRAATDTIYTIAYQNSNRDKSVEVVRVLLDSFVEGTMSGSRGGATETQDFLNKQIDDLEKRLLEDEDNLAEFQKRNIDVLPGQGGDTFTRLGQETSGLQQAETSLAVALGRRDKLEQQLASAKIYVPATSGGGSGWVPDVTVRLAEAEKRLEELLLNYTDKHYEVIALRRNIAELREREAKELAELQAGGPGTGAISSLAMNPTYQQAKSELNRVQVEIAAVQAAVRQHQKEIARLRQYVDQTPEIQQEFSRLNRTYGQTKEQYAQIVQRREQARVADDAAKTGIVRFDVIEPPRADETPVWPSRPTWIAGGLIAAIALGFALALLPQMLAPTISDVAMLERQFKLPVLGAVSALRDVNIADQQRIAIRNTALAAAALVVLALFLIAFGGSGARAIQNLIA